MLGGSVFMMMGVPTHDACSENTHRQGRQGREVTQRKPLRIQQVRCPANMLQTNSINKECHLCRRPLAFLGLGRYVKQAYTMV